VLNPKEENAWTGMANAYGAMGQLIDSLNASNEFLKRFPDSPNFAAMKNQSMTVEKELKRQGKLAQDEPIQTDNYLHAVRTSDGERHKWNNAEMPITVCIESGEGVEYWSPEFTQMLKNAFQEWADASKGSLSFKFVDDPKNAKITCTWTNDPRKLRNSAEQGDTHLSWKVEGDLQKAEITMLTRSPLNPQQALERDKIKQTALHEIGHALGIGGHSTDPKDVMYFANTSMSTPNLSERDKKTIQVFYGAAQPAPVEAKKPE
jgi:predicted Zn-dependent protease